MANLSRKRTKLHRLLLRSCTGESIFMSLSGSGRSASQNLFSLSLLGYSAGSSTTFGSNVTVSPWNIGESTQVLSGYLSYHCPEMWWRYSVSHNSNETPASRHWCTLYAPKALLEVYLCTRAFSCGRWSSIHSRSMRCAFSFCIRTSGLKLASLDSEHLIIIQVFPIFIIRCAASCWASSSSVWIACIKLITAEYVASAPCFPITVLSSGLSGTPENSHSIW